MDEEVFVRFSDNIALKNGYGVTLPVDVANVLALCDYQLDGPCAKEFEHTDREWWIDVYYGERRMFCCTFDNSHEMAREKLIQWVREGCPAMDPDDPQ